MNKIKSLIVLSGLLLGSSAMAQFGVTNFFTQAITWTSSFDTNSTTFLTNDTIELYSGTVNNNNQNMEGVFGVRINPWRGLDVGGEMNNVSAFSTVSQVDGFIGWGLTHFDTRLTPELAIGARPSVNGSRETGIVKPRLVLEKAMTAKTAARLVLDMPFTFKGKQLWVPNLTASVTAITW